MAQAVRNVGLTQLIQRDDTIAALSSGHPPAAIAIVRVSGPAARTLCQALCGTPPEPRRASLRTLRDPRDGSVLDRALVLLFPGPNSATGEDLVEFHLHGGRAVTDAVQQAVIGQPGCRLAEPGEFTRRAFENGRMDLVEAEGLADLLAAETDDQRRHALAAAEGHVSRQIEAWATRLLAISGRVEAMLDFADEDDVAPDEAAIVNESRELAADIGEVMRRPPVERLHDGPLIVLAGPPNAGKSTLLNALVERDAAIVSDIAGTTRDRIEVSVRRRGTAYRLVDTAGLHDAGTDPIESEGMARTRTVMTAADLILWLGDDPPPQENIRTIWTQPRSDMPGRASPIAGQELLFSARTGQGVAALWDVIEGECADLLPGAAQLSLNQRQRECLSEAQSALSEVGGDDMLIAAEHLRIARTALDRLLGKLGTEDMLDALFGQFCLGK